MLQVICGNFNGVQREMTIGGLNASGKLSLQIRLNAI